MTDQTTPETAAKLADDPRPPNDSPDYARAFEIQRNEARAERDRLLSELADERAKRSDALIAAVDDIERLTAENERLATGNHSMEKEIPQLRHAVERLRAALEIIAAPMRPDGWYERDRTACGSIAREALNASAQ